MKIILIVQLLSLLTLVNSLSAQETRDTSFHSSPSDSIVEISLDHVSADGRLKTLLDRHMKILNDQKGIEGYRLQIHFGNDREKATEVKEDFKEKYPDMVVYQIYDAPNFRIRVGDFRERFSATEFLKYIIENFPHAFIVKDIINLPVLTTDCDPLLQKEEDDQESDK